VLTEIEVVVPSQFMRCIYVWCSTEAKKNLLSQHLYFAADFPRQFCGGEVASNTGTRGQAPIRAPAPAQRAGTKLLTALAAPQQIQRLILRSGRSYEREESMAGQADVPRSVPRSCSGRPCCLAGTRQHSALGTRRTHRSDSSPSIAPCEATSFFLFAWYFLL